MRTPRPPRCFSLVELLVVIAIVAILISLAIPLLSRVRGTARETVTLSNLRQTAVTFHTYLQVSDDTYPFAGAGATLRLNPPEDLEISFLMPGYWDLSAYWVALMHDIAPWRENFMIWVGPGGVPPGELPWRRTAAVGQAMPSYRLAHGLFARPELWAPAPSDDPALYRPVRAHDVRYASSKVILIDEELTHLNGLPNADRDLRPMLFADSHAAVKRVSQSKEPVTVPFKGPAQRIYDTLQGARGVDY